MKITIAKGQVVIIETSITVDAIKVLSAHKPSALRLMDPETKECLFTASAAKETPNISNFGILVSKDRDIVINYDKPVTEAKVRTEHGVALSRLAALETQVTAAMAIIATAEAGVTFEVLE